MNVSKVFTPLIRQKRLLNTSNVLLQENKRQKKIKELQRLYQIDDGVPVYLKGGFKDRLLYLTTMTLCVAGLGYAIYTICSLTLPKKKE